MPTRKNNFKSIERRKQGAIARQTERENRTPIQQIERLDQLLGIDVGARRERTKLRAIAHGV